MALKIAVTGKPGCGTRAFLNILQKQNSGIELTILSSVWNELETTQNRSRHNTSYDFVYEHMMEKMQIDSLYWIRKINQRIDYLLHSNQNIYVSRICFPKDLAYLKSKGFTLIHLEADSETRKLRLGEDYQITPHTVEGALDKSRIWKPDFWDHTIKTEGQYLNFWNKSVQLIENLQKQAA